MMVTNQMQTTNICNTSHISLLSPFRKPTCLLFFHLERRKKKNRRHRGTEIVLRSVVKIKTQTMNLQSLVHFMRWHLLEQI
uniref:Smu2 n=1 Tax=Arundo donax TaxID=35708 RepID=A0A0A9DGJ1_ARUDO